jgi:glycosyltransferase involved in cell wall biosynthesis
MARNRWFQRKAVDCLRRLDLRLSTPDSRPTLFAYSYAALAPFRFARSQGWRTVLGQIDPGPVEAEIVRAEHDRHPELRTRWQPPPDGYWRAWREECALADWIVVNSEWSREALRREGVPAQKLRVIPLAYEASLTERRPERQHPSRFSPERPLRVLFLGQIILRKGVAQVLQAAELLQQAPAEFWMVGPTDVVSPDERRSGGNLRWFGSVPRREVGRFYEEADVLLFPTLSDGFGLTQLEAQAHRLPVIASRHCGAVVQHGVNGLVLPEVSAAAIVKALSACIESPANLREWSRASAVAEEFGLGRVGQRLLSLVGGGRDELPVP